MSRAADRYPPLDPRWEQPYTPPEQPRLDLDGAGPTVVDVFSPPLSREGDPHTSAMAAEKVKPHAADRARLIVAAFDAHPEGLTDDELVPLIPGHGQTTKSARTRLSKKLLPDGRRIVMSGEYRPSNTRTLMAVWVIR